MDSRTAWPSLIGALIRGESLTPDETAWAMNEIMDGAATPTQIAGFAVALRMKGETAAEVSGLAEAMMEHASPIAVPGRLVDLVGQMASDQLGPQEIVRLIVRRVLEHHSERLSDDATLFLVKWTGISGTDSGRRSLFLWWRAEFKPQRNRMGAMER